MAIFKRALADCASSSPVWRSAITNGWQQARLRVRMGAMTGRGPSARFVDVGSAEVNDLVELALLTWAECGSLVEASGTAIAPSRCRELHKPARGYWLGPDTILSGPGAPTLYTQDVGGSSPSPPIVGSPAVVGEPPLPARWPAGSGAEPAALDAARTKHPLEMDVCPSGFRNAKEPDRVPPISVFCAPTSDWEPCHPDCRARAQRRRGERR